MDTRVNPTHVNIYVTNCVNTYRPEAGIGSWPAFGCYATGEVMVVAVVF